ADLVRFWRLDRIEFWVAVVTAACGLVLGLLAAVLVGVVLTLLLVLRELDHIGVTELQPTPDGDDLVAAGPGTAPVPGLLGLRYHGPLYTANVHQAHRRVLAAVDEHQPEILVIDGTALAGLPVTVIDQFADLRRELDARHAQVWIAGLPPRSLATAQLLP